MKFVFLFISVFFLFSTAFTQREGRSAETHSGFSSPGNSAAVSFAAATNSERTSFVSHTPKKGAAGDRMYGNLNAVNYPEVGRRNQSAGRQSENQNIRTFSSRSHTFSISSVPVNADEGRTVHTAVVLNPGTSVTPAFSYKQDENKVNRKLNEVIHNQDMREILLAELALRLSGNCDNLLRRLRNTEDLTAAEIRLLLFVYQDCIRLQDMVYNRLSRLPFGRAALKIYSGRAF